MIIFVPWKTPWVNSAVLLYAGLHLVAAPGLWSGRRWAWRLSLWANLLGLLACLLVCAGFIASWAYLKAVFGDFGRGASIVSLLFASVAFQLLGLFPTVGLYALLRRRESYGGGQGWRRLLLGLSLSPLLAFFIYPAFALSPLSPISPEGRDQATAYLRAALTKRALPSLSALEGVTPGLGPLYVSLYNQGKPRIRVTGGGSDMAQAIKQAAQSLLEHPKLQGRRVFSGRLKLDRLIAVGPVPSTPEFLQALAFNSGLDGLRVWKGESHTTLLPDDLLKKEIFGTSPLIPGIREIRLGVNLNAVKRRLGKRAEGRWERIRTEGWIEHQGESLPAFRGNTALKELGPKAWRAAATAAGEYILRQIQEDGRFHYQYYPLRDHHPPFNPRRYSLPRHAGTVYSLALLYGLTEDQRFKRGAERAIAWLSQQIPAHCGGDPELGCVVKEGWANLGSTALSVVGMLEYQRRTQDSRYQELIQRQIRFILSLQRESGDFHHRYNVKRQEVDRVIRKMFSSEEAALALVMAHEQSEEEAQLQAAERALDFLSSRKYDYFLGWFIYGADHWTCIAAEEAWPRLKSKQYLDFCRGYSDFMGRIQYEDQGLENWDFAGHYGLGFFMVPQAPAAAGFSEAIISTALLARKHKEAHEVLDRQVAQALDALSRDQIRPENSWLMPRPKAAAGGIRRSLVEQEIRIDFAQHSAAALIRGAAAYEQHSL